MPWQASELDVLHSKPSQLIMQIIPTDATQKTHCTVTYFPTCLLSVYEKFG